MKRSQINNAIKYMETVLKSHCFELPDFCKWTPQDWQNKSNEYDEIRDNMLGWDVTDYGEGDFDKLGFSLITLRNGNIRNPKYKKSYAEKLLLLKEGQISPLHYHSYKMEDIINRGGGNILIRVYNSTKDNVISDDDVCVNCDGRQYTVKAGTQVCLKPGQSISISQYMYHDFEVEPGSSYVLLGEVSMCNDDNTDNHFYKPLNRFPFLEEDEEPYRLLCNEYPSIK